VEAADSASAERETPDAASEYGISHSSSAVSPVDPSALADQQLAVRASLAAGGELPEGAFLGADTRWHDLPSHLPFLRTVSGWPTLVDVRANGFDVRRTARLWMRTGRLGWGYEPRTRAKVSERLVVFWDVSGSMKPFLEDYGQLWYRMASTHPQMGVFAVGTEMKDITATLRATQGRLYEQFRGFKTLWEGGTNLGAVLTQWLREHGDAWLRGSVAVLLVSDGWDRGSEVELETALLALVRRGARLYWLNPWQDSPGFEPRTRALQVAQPYLSGMASGLTVASLASLP